MAFLHFDRHSFVLLRPTNKAKLSTQSAEKWIFMRKWAFKIWAELLLKNKKALDDQIFQGVRILLSVCPQHVMCFCNCSCPLQDEQKWLPLGQIIPTRHRLSSTDRNWQRYRSLIKPKSSCSQPNYSPFRENQKIRFQFMNCFFVPRRAFLVKHVYPRTVVAYVLGKKGPVIWGLLVFGKQFR